MPPGFFSNYARGIDPARCAVPGNHIGGLAGVGPIAAWYATEPEAAERAVLDHVSLTHGGEQMASAARLLTRLLVEILGGRPLEETLRAAMARQDSPLLGAAHGAGGFPRRWREGLLCGDLVAGWPGPAHVQAGADV